VEMINQGTHDPRRPIPWLCGHPLQRIHMQRSLLIAAVTKGRHVVDITSAVSWFWTKKEVIMMRHFRAVIGQRST